MLPDGCAEWVVHLEGGFSGQAGCLFVGQTDEFTLLHPQGRLAVFGVRFHPCGAWAFSGIPQYLTAGRIVPLDEVWGAAARHWEERVRNAADTRLRIAASETVLRGWERAGDIRTGAAVGLLLQQPGASVDSVAAQVGLSRRQLERRFRDEVGLAPKRLAALFRFHAALEFRATRPQWNWGRIAMECGYADQAHLTGDFRRFSGKPPVLRQREETAMERLLAHV